MKYVILFLLIATPSFAQDAYSAGYNAGYNSDVMNYNPMSRYGEGVYAGRSDAWDDDADEQKQSEEFEASMVHEQERDSASISGNGDDE